MNKNILAAAVAAAALVVTACATTPFDSAVAIAKLEPTKGSTTTGTVTFAQRMSRVVVTAEVRGLAPGEHGFHMHEKGDCSSGDGMSTGGHFNPLAKPHGAHGGSDHHAGDLPSVKADAYGKATISFTSKTISVGAGPTDVTGRGLIVHRDPDDFKTQPTGNAGPRVACAVIQKS